MNTLVSTGYVNCLVILHNTIHVATLAIVALLVDGLLANTKSCRLHMPGILVYSYLSSAFLHCVAISPLSA